MKINKRASAIVLGGLLTVAAGTLFAQASGLTRVMVGKADVSVPGREAVVARVEVAPGAKAGRHTNCCASTAAIRSTTGGRSFTTIGCGVRLARK